MTAPARYLFDIDFAAPPEPDPAELEAAVPTIELARHNRDLDAARKRSFEEGRTAGQQSQEAQAADQLAEEAGRIAAAAAKLVDQLDDNHRQLQKDAAAVALAASTKLASRLISLYPIEDIVGVLDECLTPLRRAPHLVIRLNQADADGLKPLAEDMAAQRGFEGRLVIMGEPEIPRGDCRIEWADGGVVLDRTETEAHITRVIDTFFQSREPKQLPAAGEEIPADDGA